MNRDARPNGGHDFLDDRLEAEELDEIEQPLAHDEKREIEATSGEEPRPAPELPTTPEPIDVERLRSALAELEDAKIRIRRDSEKQAELLRGRVLEALIPVLDNLERSIAAAESSPSVDQLRDGVKLIHSQFLDVLTRFGLERRSSIGTRFDPRVHDAIAVVPVSDANQDGVVVGEVEPAYVIGDRVVRPAKVQVGRAGDRSTA